MVESKEEALLIAQKYVDIDVHSVVIVTGNGNVYTSEKTDPADTSEKFYVKGGKDESEELTEEVKPKTKKK